MLRIFFFQAWDLGGEGGSRRGGEETKPVGKYLLPPWDHQHHHHADFITSRQQASEGFMWIEDFEFCRQVEVKEHHRGENRPNGAARSEFFFVLSLSGGFEEKDIAVSWWEVLEFWTTLIFLVGELLRVEGAELGINILPRRGRYFSCQPTCRGQQ